MILCAWDDLTVGRLSLDSFHHKSSKQKSEHEEKENPLGFGTFDGNRSLICPEHYYPHLLHHVV